MRSILVVVAGLVFGSAGSALWSGCGGCPPGQTYVTAATGKYVGVPFNKFDTIEPDYELELAADQTTVTERFSRAGKHYVTTYTVVGSGRK